MSPQTVAIDPPSPVPRRTMRSARRHRTPRGDRLSARPMTEHAPPGRRGPPPACQKLRAASHAKAVRREAHTDSLGHRRCRHCRPPSPVPTPRSGQSRRKPDRPGVRRRCVRSVPVHQSRQHRGITEVRRSSDFAHALAHGNGAAANTPQTGPASRERHGLDELRFSAFEKPLSCGFVEPMTGIEPAYSAWEADVLPLNYIGKFDHEG